MLIGCSHCTAMTLTMSYFSLSMGIQGDSGVFVLPEVFCPRIVLCPGGIAEDFEVNWPGI